MALCKKSKVEQVNFFKRRKRMRKEYDGLEFSVIIFNMEDVITASGDNFIEDPWDNFEY